MIYVLYIIIGIMVGIFGGAFGVGGGALLVPIFVLAFGMSQHMAQGTSLAVMLPPIFILAVWRYYAAGNVNVKIALIVAVGFVIGALIGAELIQKISDTTLRKTFGIIIILIGLKMVLFK